jgi:hypothetical protein
MSAVGRFATRDRSGAMVAHDSSLLVVIRAIPAPTIDGIKADG